MASSRLATCSLLALTVALWSTQASSKTFLTPEKTKRTAMSSTTSPPAASANGAHDPAASDPRLDPRLRKAYEEGRTFKIGISPSAWAPGATHDDRLAACADVERNFLETKDTPEVRATIAKIFEGVVTERTVTIRGMDGNDLRLVVRRPSEPPEGGGGKMPCIVRAHGGGMAVMTSDSFIYTDASLAREGAVVVSVDFRNSAGVRGNHPYPAGLNDMISAVEWTVENRDSPVIGGYKNLILCGESGGGNLVAAAAMRMTREARIRGKVDGVYCIAPMISNAYGDSKAEAEARREFNLTSVDECDGKMLTGHDLGVLANVYIPPGGGRRTDPIAWPLLATKEDLEGLPPFVVLVYELDPLRDEGKVFFRKLVEAGVEASCQMVVGSEHCSDLVYVQYMPDMFAGRIRDIVSFARSRTTSPAAAVAGNE